MERKRFVILSSLWEFNDYQANYHRKTDMIFPLHPLARYQCIKKGWIIYSLKDFFNEECHLEAKKRSEQSIKVLIDQLDHFSKIKKECHPIKIGTYFHLHLHIVIGQIHYNQFIINSVIKTLNPDSWLMYVFDKPQSFMGIRPDPGVIFQRLVKCSREVKKSGVIYHTQFKRPNPYLNLKKSIINWLSPSTLDIVHSIANKIKTQNLGSYNKKKILMIGPAYDWEPILADSKFKRKYNVDYSGTNNFHQGNSTSAYINQVLKESIESEYFNLLDISELSKIIYATFNHMNHNFGRTSMYLAKYDAIMATVFSMPEDNYVCDIANKMNKPVITWQHGEMNLYKEPLSDAIDVKFTTHYLCYGKMVEEKYKQYIGRTAIKNVYSVGSTKKQVEVQEPKYILYATAKWHLTASHFTGALDPDSRLFDAQKRIISYLEGISKKYKVILKSNNTPGLDDVPFQCEGVFVEHKKPFTMLLQNAQLVILDSPATTCIEVCSTSVPLFVLSGRLPWYPEATRLLKKRAIISSHPDELIGNVSQYLKNGKYDASLNDTEFFTGYGSPESKENVKNNVLKILREVI